MYSYFANVTKDNSAFTPSGAREILSYFTGDINGPMNYTMQTDTGENAVPTTLTITGRTRAWTARRQRNHCTKLCLQSCQRCPDRRPDGSASAQHQRAGGTYYPGQKIPVTLEFDEFVMAYAQYENLGTVRFNDGYSYDFGDPDLHMNARGNKLTFWYEVPSVGDTSLNITCSASGTSGGTPPRRSTANPSTASPSRAPCCATPSPALRQL